MSSNYEAHKRYTARQKRDRGLIRLTLWVPETAREQLLTLAAKLRRMARERQET